jgi:hypothetical protein
MRGQENIMFLAYEYNALLHISSQSFLFQLRWSNSMSTEWIESRLNPSINPPLIILSKLVQIAMKQNLRHLFVYCSSLFFTLQSCSSYRLPDRSTTNLQYGIDQRPPLTPDHPASYNTTPIPAPHLFHHDRQHFTNNTGFIANNANSK